MGAIWIIHSVGILLSIAFISLSIYTACRTSYFTLPIPSFSTGLAILVSLVTYPLLTFTRSLLSTPKSTIQRALLAKLTPYILLFLNTILLAISTDRLASPNLASCSLHDQWLRLFQAKDSRAIRRIQDSMECCGFRTSRDMAWPFPDNEHGSDSCEVAFGRTAGCEGAWNAEARKLLGMMVAVGGVGVLCVLLSTPNIWQGRTPWFQHDATRPHQVDSNRRLLTHTEEDNDEEQRYADDPEQGHEGHQRTHYQDDVATG